MKKLILITGLVLIANLALAYTVNLKWDANKETDLAGYKVYNDTTKARYTNMSSITLRNMTTVTTTLFDLTGVHRIYVTAYNKSGLESGPSNIVTVDYTTPQQVQNLRLVAQ